MKVVVGGGGSGARMWVLYIWEVELVVEEVQVVVGCESGGRRK